MAGYRSFAKNVGLLTIANFGTKILSFLLVPLYTSILSTADYGTYDLALNTVGVLVPLLTQNIVDAVLRFSMDRGVSKSDVLSVGIKHFLVSLVPVGIILLVNSVLGISPELVTLAPLVLFLYVSQALSGIVLYYVRGANRFSDIAVSSVMCSALIIGCNILFLVVFQWGLTGYFLANIIGPSLQSIYLLGRVGLHGVNPFGADWNLEREMLSYSRPMIANSIAWWVNNVSDRYVVTFFCGVAANGIYSVASKIPSILSVVQSIVGQAWTISAVEEFDPDDSNGFFSNMYAAYNCVMVVVCSLIVACNLILAKILYANDFFAAWQFAPFLTISIVFGALAGYVGGVLAAVKDSKEFARSSVIGAVVNILLNLITVPFVGALGAAVATLISYWITWFLRMRKLRSYMKIRVNIARDYLSYLLLVFQAVLFFTPMDLMLIHAVEAVLFISIVVLYQKELLAAFYKGRLLVKKGR